jgi:hypothetical protein
MYTACTRQAQLLLSGSSKLDKSVLIGTLPQRACCEILTDTGLGPVFTACALRQQLLLSGTSSKLTSHIDWDLA